MLHFQMMLMQFTLRHSPTLQLERLRARVKRASPESITTTGSMDSGPAHPSRLLPTWTMIWPNSGKPEVGGASTMCNCTSGNDDLCCPMRQPIFEVATSASPLPAIGLVAQPPHPGQP